jgi:predicted N-acyltransferase
MSKAQSTPSERPTTLDYPFLRKEFLNALETSGSACAETGWQPLHIIADDNANNITMPLYLKDHSMGEYVFDHAWANAYHQNGLRYYPKLVSSIPFTPSIGPRINGLQSSEGCYTNVVEQVLERAAEHDISSWHILFPSNENLQGFANQPLLNRHGVQYHWFNRGYSCFDDYLAAMNSRKRKMVRRERAQVAAQDITISVELGEQIDANTWQLFHQLYQRTYAKRNGTRGYLTEDFFKQISVTMPEQIAMAVARKEDQAIACALYFFDNESLYGRYWGSLGEYNYLHFELCYYTGIEFAIRRGLSRYDAGAQGEHKIVRGFEPVCTHSLHWIKHPEFKQAIDRFIHQERIAVAQHIEQAAAMLPFKTDDSPLA